MTNTRSTLILRSERRTHPSCKRSVCGFDARLQGGTRVSVAVVLGCVIAACGLTGCQTALTNKLPFLSSKRDDGTTPEKSGTDDSPFRDTGRDPRKKRPTDADEKQERDQESDLIVSGSDDLRRLNEEIRDLPPIQRQKIIARWKRVAHADRPLMLRMIRNSRLMRQANSSAGPDDRLSGDPVMDRHAGAFRDGGDRPNRSRWPESAPGSVSRIGHRSIPGTTGRGSTSDGFADSRERGIRRNEFDNDRDRQYGDSRSENPDGRIAGGSERGAAGPFDSRDDERPDRFGVRTAPNSGSVDQFGNRRFEERRFDDRNPSATPSPVLSGDWNETLSELIRLSESNSTDSPPPTPKEEINHIRRHAHLRLLYLLTGDTSKAMKAIPHIQPSDAEFWQKTMWGISAYLDDGTDSDRRSRATRTIRRFSEAIEHLQADADLIVRNVVFCRKINSYGNYETVAKTEFRPGEQVLLYAEIENFKTEPTTTGQKRTRLKSEIELFLKTGGEYRESIKKFEFRPTQDVCRNYRRDYFHSYIITLPQRLRLGDYVLKLTVEDHVGNKISSDTVQFIVK